MRKLAVIALLAAACDAPPDPDAILYRRAYELTAAGRGDQARQLYRQIAGGSSRFRTDGHLALAELDFKAGALDAALEHYQAVVATPGARTRPYALYKEGWCYLDKGDTARAQQAFESVVALQDDPSVPERQRKDLVAEARQALVKTYARAGSSERAADYFQKVGGAEAPALLERLAELEGDAGQWERSASTLRELIASHVDSPRLCVWQASIVRATMAGGDPKELVAEVQHLGAVLARLEGSAPADVTADCRQRLRDTNRELALLWHKRAQKTRDPALYQLVDPLYRQYLTRFGAEKDSYDMTFNHAEVLWNLQRWAQAYEEYRRVVEMNPAGQHTREAAYAAVLAARNELELDGPPAQPAEQARPFSPDETRMLAAFELYQAHVPSSPERPMIDFRRARLLYERGHFGEAAPLLMAVVEQHPDSELATYAANLHLDALARLGRPACPSVRALVAGPVAARDAEARRSWRRLASECDRREATPVR
jgi:tetratricopeptide (TPR) repeat protein